MKKLSSCILEHKREKKELYTRKTATGNYPMRLCHVNEFNQSACALHSMSGDSQVYYTLQHFVFVRVIPIIVLASEPLFGQMVFSLGLQRQVLWDIRYNPGNETGNTRNDKLENEHQSQADSYHVPVLLVELVGVRVAVVTSVPISK